MTLSEAIEHLRTVTYLECGNASDREAILAVCAAAETLERLKPALVAWVNSAHWRNPIVSVQNDLIAAIPAEWLEEK
jgi:hypothetical protein